VLLSVAAERQVGLLLFVTGVDQHRDAASPGAHPGRRPDVVSAIDELE
jgi:hypothetical protein